MIKKSIIIFFVLTGGILSNAFSSSQISLSIPDSPFDYSSNSWDDYNWTEIIFSNEGFIIDWAIAYTWITDDYPQEGSFYVLSPSGTQHTIASAEQGGTYTVSSNSFNYEPVNGAWRLWVEDSWDDGGCGATDITISIVLADSYIIVNIPEKAVEGMDSITGTVIVYPVPEQDMMVHLNSNNNSRLAVQSEASIRAGEDRTNFSMSIVDDDLFNLSSDIQIQASAPGYYTGASNLKLDDNESANITLMLPDQVINGDTIQGKISIDRNLDIDVMIPLLLNTADVNIQPETVLMPAGISEVTIDIAFLGKNIAQTISITPSVQNWSVYSDTINFIPWMIPESERQALVDLYNSTDGDNWDNSENWLGDRGTECSWLGVSCDENERHVVKIDCFNNNLKGEILPSISNLKYLSELDLSWNQLNSLPDNFGNLQNLVNLELDDNQLSSLPDNFGNLQNLSDLFLNSNQLSSLPESFGNLQSLSDFDLSWNQLTSLPESFGNLQSLSNLSLSDNQLSSLPENFGNLQSLSDLGLSDNQLSSLPESFGNLQSLYRLYLSNNQLSSLPESFGNLQSLNRLNLSNNQLSSLPESFGNLQGLSDRLNLSNNQLSSLPESFGNLQSLSNELKLPGNQLTSLPESFGNLQNITDLDLSNNQLTSLPDNFGNLQELSVLNLSINKLNNLPQNFGNLNKINNLDISINHIKTLPQDIGNLTMLTVLNASKNQIQVIPESIGNCSILSTLNLSYNQLKIIPLSMSNLKLLQLFDISNNTIEEVPESLKNLSSLKEINLSHNQIKEFPYQLSNIVSLQEIDLSENLIYEIKDEIQHFTNLMTLNLSGSNFDSFFGGRTISDKIEKLVNLKSLDLSSCSLYEIPDALFNLNNLSSLSLKDNYLKRIPENIYHLKNLITLNLEFNWLSGNIDESICHLLNLRSLNLSRNYRLKGDIPLELSKLKNLVYLNFYGGELYTTSPALERFIKNLMPEWKNKPPELFERTDLCIKSITTSSDNIGYSLNSKISILVAMTQPVTLTGGELVITLETGDTDRVIYAPPFTLSYTATAIYTVQEGDFSKDLNVKSILLSDGANLTNKDGEAVDLTLISEINLAATSSIYVDGNSPSIEITSPRTLCVENLDKIKGIATDISKDYSVEVSIFNEQNKELFHNIQYFFNIEATDWEFEPQINWTNQEYQILVKTKDFVGNIATKEFNFSFGKKPSTINCNISKSEITYGELFTISGQIMPIHNLSNQPVDITLISPEGDDESVSTSVNQNGLFSYHLKCHDITMHGQWKIKTSWNGNDCLLGATSNSNDLTVHRAKTEIFLDLTSDAVKVGDPFSIGGIFEPSPACKGNDLSGKEILLSIGNKNEYIKTNDSVGHFQLKDYDQLNIPGSYKVKAAFLQDDTYEGSDNVDMTINILEASGYAIIVQVQIPSGEGTKSYSKTTMFVRGVCTV